MTALDHRTSASDGGKGRWVARCVCKWWTPAASANDASERMNEHRKIADAARLVQHDCYDAESMEYGGCARCILDQLLAPRRAA